MRRGLMLRDGMQLHNVDFVQVEAPACPRIVERKEKVLWSECGLLLDDQPTSSEASWCLVFNNRRSQRSRCVEFNVSHLNWHLSSRIITETAI